MSFSYEEGSRFARKLAARFDEPVKLVGETSRKMDGNVVEFINPDGESIQGMISVCGAFTEFPINLVVHQDLEWSIEFRGLNFESLDPVDLIEAVMPHGHYWYPRKDVVSNLDAAPCTCGTVPRMMAVYNDGTIMSQFMCPKCGRKAEPSEYDGDAAENWNKSLRDE